MPAVNKQSIRDEVARLQSEMDSLSDKEGAINAEVKILMQSMFLVINLMLSIFLEKITKKNSENSSIPPSQTETDNSSLPESGSKGKGKNEDDHLAANTRTRETTVTVEVQTCDTCGEDLSDVPCAHHERRTKIDIIFEKVVEHTDVAVLVADSQNWDKYSILGSYRAVKQLPFYKLFESRLRSDWNRGWGKYDIAGGFFVSSGNCHLLA